MSKNVRGGFVSFVGAVIVVAVGAAAAGTAQGSNEQAQHLGASLAPSNLKTIHEPGDPIAVSGRIFQLDGRHDAKGHGVPATFSLQALDADGAVLGTYGPYTAASDGNVDLTLPGSATSAVEPDSSTDFKQVVALQLVDASYGDTDTPDGTPAGEVGLVAPPTGPVLKNSFVSSVGWVKPGDK